ncbi:MAG: N-acetyl-gamma-glutamyl-phosphate reductase [Phycisphaeraceae bacterium]|nr:N-acetyl-gamma-glutamyl-phosphate reductase [Phycisphaeraceae bacterium]
MTKPLSKARCVVVGAPGYAGAELCRLLINHPHAEIVGLFGSAARADADQSIADIFPRFRARLHLPVAAADPAAVIALRPDAVFLCTPHEASVNLAAALLDAGLRVFDLSAAFRLRDPALYPAHYGFTHEHPHLLETAVYGLVELHRQRLPQARLVAVPGCYPTCAILPLAPLVRAGALRPGTNPVINAISGISGAGRAAKTPNLFCEVGLRPYGVLEHRHQPEISLHAGVEVDFVPHVAPLCRGMVCTTHVHLAQGWNVDRARAHLAGVYAREPFIRLLPRGLWPDSLAVERTNFCDIALTGNDDRGRLVLCSAIDNLTKGAAGQALQCMNVTLGFPETTALEVL